MIFGSHDAANTTHLKGGLFYWIIILPTLRDENVPTNWNDYKFFCVTQKVLEIDMMVYNMTKNEKISKKAFLVTVLDN